MARFTLRLAAAKDVPADEVASSFYWLSDQRSSFTPGIGPTLSTLGAVPALNIDVVRVALSAFAADRSVLREGGGSNWNQRSLELEIPVSDPTAWDAVAEELAGVLGLLSGDRWSLSFTQEDASGRQFRCRTSPLRPRAWCCSAVALTRRSAVSTRARYSPPVSTKSCCRISATQCWLRSSGTSPRRWSA